MMIRHEGDDEDVKHREDVLCLQSVVLHDAGKVVDQKLHEGLDVHVVGAIERGASREQRGQLAPTGLIGNLDYNFKISTSREVLYIISHQGFSCGDRLSKSNVAPRSSCVQRVHDHLANKVGTI